MRDALCCVLSALLNWCVALLVYLFFRDDFFFCDKWRHGNIFFSFFVISFYYKVRCIDNNHPLCLLLFVYSSLRWLLADGHGVLSLLQLTWSDASRPQLLGMTIEALGRVSPASALVYLDAGLVFVGSAAGDSQLVRVKPLLSPFRSCQLFTVFYFFVFYNLFFCFFVIWRRGDIVSYKVFYLVSIEKRS
jgi:hypothetical protein